MPKSYSLEEREQIINHVCDELSKARALSRICDEDEGMPSAATLHLWAAQDALISDRFERARATGATKLLDEIVEIADNAVGEAYIAYDKDGKPYAKIDGDTVQRAKLRVYARERYAQLIAPGLYGNKVDVTSGGKPLPAPAAPQMIDARVNALLVLAAERAGKGEMIDVTPSPSIDELMS